MIMATHDNCLIAGCKDFLKAAINDQGLDKIKPLLLPDCLYSSGFDSDTEDNVFSCIKTNFVKKISIIFVFLSKNYFENLSEELHHITNMF